MALKKDDIAHIRNNIIFDLYSNGDFSKADIARVMNISRQLVDNIIKESGVLRIRDFGIRLK